MKHFRVGGVKRSEIIAELQSHLHELPPDTNITKVMGEPKTLAHSYNIEHLGTWRGVSWMLLTPFVAWFFLMIFWSRLHHGPRLDNFGEPSTSWWYIWGQPLTAILVILGLSIFVVSVLSRFVRPWRTFICLLIMAWAIGTYIFGSMDYISHHGMLDPNRIDFGTPGDIKLRDRKTGRALTEADFPDYVIPVNPIPPFGTAGLFFAIPVGAFGVIAYLYICYRQRKTQLRRQ